MTLAGPRPLAAAWTLAIGAAAALAFACGDTPFATPCQDIPEGGCPDTAVDGCSDRTCLAIYSCGARDSAWHLVQGCPANEGDDAGSGDSGPLDGGDGGDASDGALDSRVTTVDGQASVPGAGGGPGCVPLQAPDCSLALAEACAGGCCECEDLYVCQDGGWNPWGSCRDGVVHAN